MARRDGPSDRYLPQRVLGEGGAGRVWLVEDTLRPGYRLALKELAAGPEGGTHHEEAFRKEFATLACLHHPNLVEVHEFDTSASSGLPRFTLEFIKGRDIVDAVRHEGPGALMDLVAESLRALAFLHDFDLIHRDLKPANLLVRDTPKLGCRLVIVDFGLAHGREDDPVEASRAKGTLPYMAPELFRNEPAGRRSDLYALGAVLHEAVYGAPPFSPRGANLTRLVRDASAGLQTLPALPEGFPRGLDRWLLELLSPDPERRPARAGEALARLNAACETSYPAETPVSRAARLRSGAPAEREASLSKIWSYLKPRTGPRVVWVCGGPRSGKTRLLRWLEAEAILEGWQVTPSDLPRISLDEIRRSARDKPTLLLLDEMDSAGRDTVELVDRIAREGERPPVQVVASLRPGVIQQPSLRRLFADTGTVPTLARVDLGPLDADGIRAMACRATGSLVSDERVEWLLDASEGSPGVAEALLVEGAWEQGRRVPAKRRAGAPSGRLEMLSPDAARWLLALSVLRRNVMDGHVTELSGLDPAAARNAAEEVAGAGLVYRKTGRWQPESRALVDQVLARVDADRSRELHGAAAELLVARLGEEADPWLLWRLWSEAGENERAVRSAVAAAERAEADGDPAAAAHRYGQALRLLGRGRESRHDLRSRQARALSSAGLYAAAARALATCVRHAPDEESRTAALTRRAHALVRAGRFDLALDVAERAAERASRSGNTEHLALAKKAAGIVLGRLGREREAIPLLENARDLLRDLGRERAEADVLQILATCRSRLGEEGAERDYHEAIDRYDRAAREGWEPTDGQDLKARIGLAVIQSRSGKLDDAAALLETVRKRAAERRNLGLEEAALSRLSLVAIEQGRLDRAMALAEQAADLALHLGDHNLILVNRCRLADAQIRCGRSGEAIAGLRQELERPLARVEPENADYARMLLANAWMESGNADEETIRLLLERSLARCRKRRKRRAWLMALVIEMERRARPDCTDAFEPADTEFETVVKSAEEAPDPEILVRANLARAAFGLSRGDAETARAAADEASRIARERGAMAFEARSLAVLGEALLRLGRESAADEAREAGRGLLERAAARMEDDAVRDEFLSRPVFSSLRETDSLRTRRNQSRLLALYDMIRVLNSERDPGALLEAILDMTLRAVRAERGLILLKDDGEEFSVHVSRNLENETVRDAESYSRRIVAEAGAGKALLTLDAGTDPRFRELQSVSLYGIRSLMCVPLRSRGAIVGTVYVDSRRGGELFTQDDLRFLESFADQAALALENARARVRLEVENRDLRVAAEQRTEFANLVGRSPGMQAVFDLLEKVATTDLPVLIRGESGTGKELVARAIHSRGPRRRRPFLSENCAAIPETLLESELFGHVRGAFTGADRTHPGLFEQADGGTLFLDEVGDMPAAMQSRLLRVLEEGIVRPVGGEKTITVDVRVVAATHRDLTAGIKEGTFREDLFYRLQVLTIELPPLRKRPGDIALLTAHFLGRIARERGRDPVPVDDRVLSVFEKHAWPGNVRELQNTLQRLALLAGDGAITPGVIASDPQLRRTLLAGVETRDRLYSLKTGEREQVERAIAAAGGNRVRAAKLLGVSRATLYRKIKQHGL